MFVKHKTQDTCWVTNKRHVEVIPLICDCAENFDSFIAESQALLRKLFEFMTELIVVETVFIIANLFHNLYDI